MGYCTPEPGTCERCGVAAMLWAVAEDDAPSHCENCLERLSAQFEAYAEEEE